MAETVLDDLELIEVERSDDKQRATLTFLDEEHGEVREVTYSRQSFDPDKKEWYDDPEKAKKADEWAQEYFKTSYDTLEESIGSRHKIFAYDNFASMYHVDQVAHFEEDMVGQIVQAKVSGVVDNGAKIVIQFEYEGDIYASNMTYSRYLEVQKKWFPNPQLKTKKYADFLKKFHVPVSEADKLIGKNIMVEVKRAFGKFIYADIKPLPKPKKGGK